MRIISLIIRRCIQTGNQGLSHSAVGMPSIVFGRNQLPRRIEMSHAPRVWAVSTATSQAEFPAPTTSTRSPARSEGRL